MTFATNKPRLGLAVAGIATLGVPVLLAVGSAAASDDDLVPCDPNDPGPIVELCEPSTIIYPPGGIITTPDDDGPTITVPPGGIITVPGLDDDGPTITVPPGGIITVPGLDVTDDDPDELPSDTTDPPSDQPPDTTAPPVDQPTGTTTPPAVDGASQQPESPGQTGLLLPAVRITEAVVSCDGSVRVAYDTSADPAFSADAEHLVSVSPLDVPAMTMTQRLVQQPLNGAFAAEIAAPADAYRVFLLVDFEPGNPDGTLLAAEATAAAPSHCPVG